MFDRYSGFVRRFCREGPILRNPETGRTSLPRSRTCGRSALSPAAFPVLSPGARYVSGRIIQCPGNSSCFFSLVFRRVAGIAARRGLSSETERCGSEDRCVRMPNRPGIPAPVRPVGQPACTRAAASSIAGVSSSSLSGLAFFGMNSVQNFRILLAELTFRCFSISSSRMMPAPILL